MSIVVNGHPSASALGSDAEPKTASPGLLPTTGETASGPGSPARLQPVPGPWQIREQIERVAGHHTFSRSPTSLKLLRFFGENILDKGGRPVSQRDVADVLLGLSTDFRPTANPLVRMQVVRLRRKLIDYYAGDGAADPVLLELPKGRYRIDATWNAAAGERLSASMPDGSLEQQPGVPLGGGPATKAVVLVTEFSDRGLGPDWGGLAAAIAGHLVPGLLGHERFFGIGPLHRRRIALEGLEPQAARDHFRADYLLDGDLTRTGDSFVATLRLLAPMSDVPVWTHWCSEAIHALPLPAAVRAAASGVATAPAEPAANPPPATPPSDPVPGAASAGRSSVIDALGEILAGRIALLLRNAFPAGPG